MVLLSHKSTALLCVVLLRSVPWFGVEGEKRGKALSARMTWSFIHCFLVPQHSASFIRDVARSFHVHTVLDRQALHVPLLQATS